MKINNCLWCESGSLLPVAKRKDGIIVVCCQNCRLIMLSEIPENISEDYNKEDYFNGEKISENVGYNENYDLTSPIYLYWQKLLLLTSLRSATYDRFLEIGCATGSLLQMLQEENIPDNEYFGIDISNFAINIAKQKKLNVELVSIEEFRSEKKFDVIFSVETMEHVENSKTYIKSIKENLNENGIFLFYIPSVKIEEIEKYNDDYKPFSVNFEHILYFTKEFIENELSRYFDTSISVYEFSIGSDTSTLGFITKSYEQKELFNELLQCVSKEKIEDEKNKSSEFLFQASVLSAKFGKYQFAESLLEKSCIVCSDPSRTTFFFGLVSFMKGELYKAKQYFLQSFQGKPIENTSLKIFYGIENALLKYNENLIKNIGVGYTVKRKRKLMKILFATYFFRDK